MRDILPIIVVLLGFQIFVLRRPVPHPGRVALGFLYVLIGMIFFLLGLEEAIFPLGEVMARQLTNPEFIFSGLEKQAGIQWRDYYWVYIFAAAIGFSTTIAEPALIAVAIKAEEVSGGAIRAWNLRIAVAIGVAFGVSLGCFRIVTGTSLWAYIFIGYIIVIVQTMFTPKDIIPLAYDSGGVTTSTVTVPLVAALGLGLANSIPGRSTLIDGFGLIAFASLFPIISVMAYAQISHWMKQRENSKEGGS